MITDAIPEQIGEMLVSEFYHASTPEEALKWFEWFLQRELALICQDESGIQGIVVFRPVPEVPSESDFYTIDEGGSIFWIDLLILKGSEQAETLSYPERFFWHFVADRFNADQFKQVGWRRRKYGGRVALTDFPKFYERMLKG